MRKEKSNNLVRCLIVLVLLTLPFLSYGVFKVYSINGKVFKQIEDKRWIAIKKQTQLQSNDFIKVSPGSSIRILDTSTREIYSWKAEGQIIISNLIKNIREENRSLTSKIIADSKHRFHQNEKSANIVGAARRETFDEEEIETIYSSIHKFLENPILDNKLEVEKIFVDDKIFLLKFSNISNSPMFLKVFVKPLDNKWASLDVSGPEETLFLPPKETLELPNLLYESEEESKIIIVGHIKDFDADEIIFMLNESYEPTSEIIDENLIVHIVQ